jgi:hypothetical protein
MFAKQLLHGDIAPHLRAELTELFDQFINGA